MSNADMRRALLAILEKQEPFAGTVDSELDKLDEDYSRGRIGAHQAMVIGYTIGSRAFAARVRDLLERFPEERGEK